MSKSRTSLATLGAATVAIVGLASWLLIGAKSDVASPDADRSTNSPTTAAPSKIHAKDSSSSAATTGFHANLPDDRPFAELRPELERRAAAGDGAAARRLGLTLANCNRYAPVSTEDLETVVVETVARGFSLRDKGRALAPDEILARIRLNYAQKDRDCKGVSGLDDSDAYQHAFEWIERGAQLGDADAQALYGSLAFVSYDARTALVDAEQIRERKRQAIEYLDSSLAQGDALALLQLSAHYSAGNLYPANAETAYAYLYAYSLTARASDIVPELLEKMLATGAEPLDENARARARDEGSRVAACCGIIVPEGQ